MISRLFIVFTLLGLLISPVHAGIDKEFGSKTYWWTPHYNQFLSHLGLEKSYALVVGVGKYDDNTFVSLPSEQDAIRIKDYLINNAGFDHVRLITGDKVTRERIHGLMNSFYLPTITSKDRFLFYWSGHGVTAGQSRRKLGYLPVKRSNTNPATMVSMQNVRNWDDQLKAKQTLYLLDSCFSGIAAAQSMSPTQEQTLNRVNHPSRQVLTAGLESQQTIAINDLKGGVFTRALLDGLEGRADTDKGNFKKDGVVTARELEAYIRERVDHERRRVGWQSPITPVLYSFRDYAGDFFFVSDKRKLSKGALIQNRTTPIDGVVATGIHINPNKPAAGLGSTIVGNSTQAYVNSTSPLGTNTNEVLEYDASVPFLDLFKSSLPFREAAPHLTKGQVEYDNDGWPTYISPGGMAGTRLINRMHEDAIPRGYYNVFYEGSGKLEYGLDAKLVHSEPGRDVIELNPGNDKQYSVKLTIKSTTRGNHLRNIRVLPLGGICRSNPFERVYDASQCGQNDFMDFERHYGEIIFNPDYLKFMRDYKVIRFMNMSGVTRNPIRHWKDRPLVQNATWGGAEGVRGAPIEIMVELANRLNADPWFNIPHGVDDDYVRRFAQYVDKHLDKNLKVYLEYSNETWNGIFTQHAHMKQNAIRLGIPGAPHIAGWKYYSKRSVEIFKIWEQTFGSNQRLIRVLAGLTGITEMTETMLKYEEAYKHVDAFAVAPYVFGDYSALRRAHSVEHIFQVMQDKRYRHSLPRVLEAVRKQSAMTRKYGVDLIAYEGGQHLIDDKTKKEMQHPNPLFYEANRHPQMGVLYENLLAGWKQAGGKMFVHFSSPRKYNRFGSKGIKEYITQPDYLAPKQMAVKNFIKNNPCWWPGCSRL